ncbi:MAG: sulfurtransferase [Gammaproteobacteria bacterium]|nr:sulfurtransferase [Gammaproteobacteria bacterium]
MKTLFKSFLLFLFLTGTVQASSVMVSTDWLQKNINNKNIVLVDMSTDETQYQRFHLPGAIYISYGYLVEKRKKDKVSFRVSDKRFYKVLGYFGIKRDDHVVIYDDMGGLNAGRLFWQLQQIGHEKISVVNGGLVKWILEGRKVENKPNERASVVYTPSGGKKLDNEIDLDQIKSVSKSAKATLLDVRTKEEYIGHPKYKRSGHIPGAKLWSWDDSLDYQKGFTLKSEKELEASLKKVGVTDKAAPIVVYCRSGHRASQSYLTLKHLGFKNVRLYDGSMSEYSKDKSAPVKQGMAP